MSNPSSAVVTPKEASPDAAATTPGQNNAEPVIDPELADLPAPPHHSNGASAPSSSGQATLAVPPRDMHYPMRNPGDTMGITESIASAPNPHTTDFSPLPFTTEEGIDIQALEAAADDTPGSPTARLMRAIAPPNAAQPNSNWPPPPPNASVNLFIGRALLSNGNDNWPLKPNDIVNWIRKHYPEEWDGDEGRCSAHRVRTYLARKGADMYYEKLNQGCIAGWRIRQNHLWRFESGGFQGRGMKQEEAIAQQQKENEIMATAAHKAAAAAALAQGHPGVKVSMSATGISDGTPAAKRARKSNGQARRKSDKKKPDDDAYDYNPHESTYAQPSASYSHMDPSHGTEPPTTATGASGIPIDPSLTSGASGLDAEAGLDVSLVQQAMAAAAASAAQVQMDDLEMGMQLPIEMQMHTGTHDDDGAEDATGYRAPYSYDTQAYDGAQGYGYASGQGQVYGNAYQQDGQ